MSETWIKQWKIRKKVEKKTMKNTKTRMTLICKELRSKDSNFAVLYRLYRAFNRA